jgi:hypothetical protein
MRVHGRIARLTGFVVVSLALMAGTLAQDAPPPAKAPPSPAAAGSTRAVSATAPAAVGPVAAAPAGAVPAVGPAAAGPAAAAPAAAGPAAAAPAAAAPAAAGPAAPAAPSTPKSVLLTRCVAISDAGFFARKNSDRANSALKTPATKSDMLADCQTVKPRGGTLTGIGQVQVAVDAVAFAEAQAAKRNGPGQFTLFLNGVGLRTDAVLLAATQVDSLMVFRFRLNQGPELQRLWTMAYADGYMRTPGDLYAGIAWTPEAVTDNWDYPVRSGAPAKIRITTDGQLSLAALLIIFSIAVVWYLGKSTSALRDAETPPWWVEAKARQRSLRGRDEAERNAYVLAQKLDPGRKGDYIALADRLLAGATIDRADEDQARTGLVLHPRDWHALATFSLSRTQLALWFSFTVVTALFLWLIYGDLRRIDGSLLALLGISGTTAVVSWVSDRGAGGKPFVLSKGFWNDLLTDFDDTRQLHRYQSVVVNLLLVLIGVFHVVQQLTYPVFDTTWLALLGVSGTLYSGGKEVLETK